VRVLYSAEGFKEGEGVIDLRTLFYGLLLADRLKLSNERLERTYTSYTSPCLNPQLRVDRGKKKRMERSRIKIHEEGQEALTKNTGGERTQKKTDLKRQGPI